ncbi:MAG: rod shape-determining protein [Oscillospiraceae bacterium]
MAIKITPVMKIKAVENAIIPDLSGKDIVFALDIGTRSVIGLIGYFDGEFFNVIDSEIQNHSHRCMVDGQIQDIGMVSAVVLNVKKKLEERNNLQLKEVSIAAAGRALITENSFCERKIDSTIPITKELISSLEMEAVQGALKTIEASSLDKKDFYCVGHSVVTQTLDKYPITNLVGHKGENVRIEIIAAFLPSTVVESLYTAMNEADLKAKTITLEPIAAINALIPEELRMLNLALVDIGAGTSDIAISRDGTVVSYEMATIAGDEITESLIKTFLVDFQTAEKIKISLSNNTEKFHFTDILGFSYEKTYDEVFGALSSSLDSLVETICQKIIEINKTAPTAIFLAGGGSLIPNISNSIADRLKMDKNRVAIKSNNYLKNVKGDLQNLNNPQYVTPIGIALTAIGKESFDFYSVTLNGERIRIFDKDAVTVSDVLSLGGIKSKQLIGLSGRSLIYELDGKKITQYGGMSVHGKILVNSQEANIRTEVKTGDKIEVTYGENGENANITINDIVNSKGQGEAMLEDIIIPLKTFVTVNGENVTFDYIIKNYDIIKTTTIKTVFDAAIFAHISVSENDFYLSEEKVGLMYKIQDGDIFTCKKKQAENLFQQRKSAQPIANEPIDKDNSGILNERNSISVIINGFQQKMPIGKNGALPLFAEATAYADIDLKNPQGNVLIKLNGENTSYTTVLSDGDVIDIGWEKIKI